MNHILKEPLVHFLILGAALFAVFEWIGGDGGDATAPATDAADAAAPRSISKEIVVSKGKIQSLVAQFGKVWQRPPTEQELAGLIDEYVREEVLYREALALELDRDDTIIRRRLRQKIEFFTEDIAALKKPTEQNLSEYLASHPSAYRLDAKFTFKQVYLNAKKRAGSIAVDITSLLATLRAAGATADITEVGDSLLLEQAFEAMSQRDVSKMFGQEFSEGLLKTQTGSWQGPVRSGFGVHLVFVSERIDGRSPSLDEVRGAVERDWSAAKRKESNEAIYLRWREGYTVTVEERTVEKEVGSN